MRLKQFAFLLLITLWSHSLQSEENENSKNYSSDNPIQNTFNKNFGEVIIHVVKKGDTLSSISKKYSIKKESIIKLNKLPDENYIFVGQNLRIVENLIPENKNNENYHQIKKGENLTEIASKYNISLSRLIEINKIDNEDVLKVGTKLRLKEESIIKTDSAINESPDLTGIDKQLRKKYGPLVIEFDKKNKAKRKIFLKATHKNKKKFILHINCDKKEINVRGIGRKWKGWMPAREKFENELLNDYCLEFD